MNSFICPTMSLIASLQFLYKDNLGNKLPSWYGIKQRNQTLLILTLEITQ